LLHQPEAALDALDHQIADVAAVAIVMLEPRIELAQHTRFRNQMVARTTENAVGAVRRPMTK
jgi:phage baseplate assembly protein W